MFGGTFMRRLAGRALPAATALVAAGAGGSLYTASALESAPPGSAPAGLDPSKWTPLTLSKITKLTHNTAIYRFAYNNPEASSGMTVASCLLTKAAIGSEKPDGSRANVMRPYTPISRPDVKGYLELAVKTYPDGKMSQHMAKLKVGDKLDFKGPIVKTTYKANEFKEVGMVAGGTGIAPMLQVADEILENPSDKTKIKLVFANVSETDILLKDQIDAKAAKHPDKLSVCVPPPSSSLSLLPSSSKKCSSRPPCFHPGLASLPSLSCPGAGFLQVLCCRQGAFPLLLAVRVDRRRGLRHGENAPGPAASAE